MKIIKFGKPNCPPCAQVTKFLKDREINYVDINPLETEDFDLLIRHNIKTVPVTILVDENGNELQRSVGFNEIELKQLINE